jgi:hypothetical protein
VDKSKVNQYKDHPHYGLDTIVRIGLGPQSLDEAARVRELKKPTYEYDLPRFE